MKKRVLILFTLIMFQSSTALPMDWLRSWWPPTWLTRWWSPAKKPIKKPTPSVETSILKLENAKKILLNQINSNNGRIESLKNKLESSYQNNPGMANQINNTINQLEKMNENYTISLIKINHRLKKLYEILNEKQQEDEEIEAELEQMREDIRREDELKRSLENFS